MKLSQPKSAREINTFRVLDQIRKHPDSLSKAEISRILDLNKVSTGEIVDALVESGMVVESSKMVSANGRRPTALSIKPDFKYILAVDIGPKMCVVALSDLNMGILRYERIPTDVDSTAESFVVSLLKSCMRTLKLAPQAQVLGCAITIQASLNEDNTVINFCPFLPFKDIPMVSVFEKALNIKTVMTSCLSALILAEDLTPYQGKSILYVNWGDSIDAALVKDKKIFSISNSFGHLKIAQTGLCSCGHIGCLEAFASSWALSQNKDTKLEDVWESVDISTALKAFAKALSITQQACGFDLVILSGQGSTIPPVALKSLQACFDELTHPYDLKAKILASSLGPKANIQGTINFALDQFIFHQSLLSEVEHLI